MHINNKTIIKDDNPILRNKSKKVDLPLDKKDKTVLLNMLQYVRDSHDPDLCEKYDLRAAVGIAAIQLGIEKQMLAVCIETEEKTTEYALVNAKIVSYSLQDAYLANGEGCLSAAVEHEGHVFRHARVTIRAYDLLQDKEITIRAKGYEAIVLQHEIDHFSGIMYYDSIDSENPWKEDNNAIVIE
ncbi:MAG: peptide deformylase [Erysipelotrichaceae bacterium]